MPRQSAEARAAAAYNAGSAPPKAPKHLSREATAVWRQIVSERAVDWFDAGSLVLLENYCELTVEGRRTAKELVKARKRNSASDTIREIVKRQSLISLTLSTLGTKLRLTVQAQVERHSRKILERGQAPITGKAKARDRLLGGEAVWGEGGRAKPN